MLTGNHVRWRISANVYRRQVHPTRSFKFLDTSPTRGRRPCQRPHIYTLHAGSSEHSGALGEGGAGGHHIVDERDMWRKLTVGPQRKRAADIAVAANGVELGLRGRGAQPLQEIVMERNAELA